MRHLLFLFMGDFILIKGNIYHPLCGLLTSLTLQLKCLECGIKPRLHWLMQAFLIKACSFGLCEMASVFKARTNPQSNRPGNLKKVAGFKNQDEL